MRGILSSAPLDLVDLLFDFEGLEIVELRLVGLEFGVEFVLAGFFLARRSVSSMTALSSPESVELDTHCLVALEQDDTATLVTSSKVVSRVVELNGRYDVG